MDICQLLTTASTGTGLARLARAALQLMPAADDEAMHLAVRVVFERLFRQDEGCQASARVFAFAARELGRARERRTFASGDTMFIDFVRAACLARSGEPARSHAIIDESRDHLRRAVHPSATHMQDAFDIIAAEVCTAQESADDGCGASVRAEPAATARRLVLFVEDDDDVRSSVTSFLTDNGFDVVTAADGAQAVALLEQGVRPGVILLDLMMPVMNGWDFYRWQQSSPSAATPTIVYTATGLRPGAMGSVHIMAKTCEPRALLAALTAVSR